MDKRKMNGGGVEDVDDRAAKRRKLPTVSIFLYLQIFRTVGDQPIMLFGRWHWRLSQGSWAPFTEWLTPRIWHRPRDSKPTKDHKADRTKDHIDLSRGETAETTTALGLKLIDTVKNTADKR